MGMTRYRWAWGDSDPRSPGYQPSALNQAMLHAQDCEFLTRSNPSRCILDIGLQKSLFIILLKFFSYRGSDHRHKLEY